MFLKLCIFRILSLIFVQTYYVPDEYWQTLEISHRHSFGYGYKTWEYHEGIRNYLFPSIFYVLYNTLKFLQLDSLFCLVYFPRILVVIVTAISDVCFIKLTRQFYISSKWAYLAILTDWYTFYSCSRTIINTFEYHLIIFGLFHFPWNTLFKKDYPSFAIFSSIVCVSCYIRPTSCIIWAPLCLYWFLCASWKEKTTIVLTFFKMFVICSLILLSIDSYMYGKLTVTPWNFFKFNFSSGLSNFYGTHPSYWYLVQGFPVVAGPMIVPFLCKIGSCLKYVVKGGPRDMHLERANYLLLFTITVSLFIYSMVPHKEFRFIHPIMPMVILLALQALEAMRNDKLKKIYIAISIMSFIIPTLFFGLIHQRGPLTLMNILSSDALERPDDSSFLFLLPCHSTPLYSHLHVNVPVRFITCEPPLNNTIVDESDEFFASPVKWLDSNFIKISKTPSHVIIFDSLQQKVEKFLKDKQYHKAKVIFHSLLPEGRTGRNILIYHSLQWSQKLIH